MSILLESTIILFGQNPFSHLGRNFRHGTSYNANEIAIFGVTALAIGVLIAIVSRYLNARDRRYCNPKGLFVELCKAHGLSRGDAMLLRRIAKSQQVGQPAMLFLDPDRFSEDDGEGEVSLLRDKIFGTALTAQ